MKRILLLGFICFQAICMNAQYGTAHDFTVTDINGNEHSLYQILDSGKLVMVDVSATWCPPCWTMHQSHAMQEIYDIYGPEGTNQVEIFFYEGDVATTSEDLNGTGSNTLGDWVTGVTYPIVDETGSLTLDLNIYAPLGFPTISLIRPSDREIVEDMWNFDFGQMQVAVDDMIAAELTSSVDGDLEVVSLQVGPNPTSDFINITTELNIVATTIVDAAGRVLMTNTGNNTSLDVSSLATGTYFLNVQLEDNKVSNLSFVKN